MATDNCETHCVLTFHETLGGLEVSITNRLAATNQVVATSVSELGDDFFRMDQRKNEFLATLAHELRNPLAPIKNGLQLLSFMGLNQEAEDLRAMMSRQVDQIVRLVDDLLDISRISCGKVALHKQPLSLSTVITAAVEESIGLIKEKEISLVVSDKTQSACVFGDLGRLTQVICNLLNNSAKYGKRGGTIRLSLEVEGSTIDIQVTDDGIGISQDRLKDIFCMYSQVESSQARGSAGLGIGLALVRSLVELHGGLVEASSGGLGCGSTFTVCLPLASKALVEKVPESLPPKRPSRSFRVLLVDDLYAMRIVASKLLETLGHVVQAVENGQLALDVLNSFKPDVVISDITMPVMDGYELARRIRQRTELEGVCLIALTGYGQTSDRENAILAGFDHHITKPVDFQHLQLLFDELDRESETRWDESADTASCVAPDYRE